MMDVGMGMLIGPVMGSGNGLPEPVGGARGVSVAVVGRVGGRFMPLSSAINT